MMIGGTVRSWVAQNRWVCYIYLAWCQQLLVVRRDGGTIVPTSQAYRDTVGAEMDGEQVQASTHSGPEEQKTLPLKWSLTTSC